MNTDGCEEEGAETVAVPAPSTQRERLLHAMARTVAAHGYAATTIAGVLREAGISRRTFYERFADKEDCFLAAYDAFTARCIAQASATFDAAPTWEQGVERGLQTMLCALAREPAFARLTVVEVFAVGPRGLARREATLRCLASFVHRGDARRERPDFPSPDLVAQAIVGGIHELVYSTIVRDETTRLPSLDADLLHYTFMLLGSPSQQG